MPPLLSFAKRPLGPVRDPIDPDVSARINVLRAILIGLIVLCHGGRWIGGSVPFASPVVTFVLAMINQGLDCAVIPLFFAISGFLLLRKLEATPAAYGRLLRGKVIAIGVPLLIFNGIWIAWLLGVGSIPFFASKSFVLNAGIVQKLLGIGTPPLNYPLWFLRDLLLVFAATPLFMAFFRWLPLGGLVLLGLWWFLGAPDQDYSLPGFFFAFYAGGLLVRMRVNLRDTAGWDRYVLPLFVGFLVVLGLQPWLGLDAPVQAGLNKAYQIVGVAGFWCISRQRWVKGSRMLHRMAAMSFFVFLTHEPTVSVLQASLMRVWQPASTLGQLVAYPAVGLAAIVALSLLGWGLAVYVPRLFSVLTGAPLRLRFSASTSGSAGAPLPVGNKTAVACEQVKRQA